MAIPGVPNGTSWGRGAGVVLFGKIIPRTFRIRPGSIAAPHMNVCLAECSGTHQNGRGQFFSERSSLDQPDSVLDRLLYAQMSVCSAKCSGNPKLMWGTPEMCVTATHVYVYTHMCRHIYTIYIHIYIYIYIFLCKCC